MKREERMSIRKSAKQIVGIAKTKRDADRIIEQILVNVAVNSMQAEQDAWFAALSTTPGVGEKTIAKIIMARKGIPDKEK